MLIGILSDSHGRHLMVRRAVELFDRLGAEHVIHCGDICGERVFEELLGRPCTFVWGNMDMPDGATVAYLRSLGFQVPVEIPTIVNLGGKRIAVFHGHERGFENAPVFLDADYILHGHTHVARDERFDAKRIINPGALHRARRTTVATLDTDTDVLTFHEISPEKVSG